MTDETVGMIVSAAGSVSLLAPSVVLDVRKKTLPVWLLAGFGVFGLVVQLAILRTSVLLTLTGLLPGVILLVAAALTKEKIGYGDGALSCALGAWIGGPKAAGAVLSGLILGGLFGTALIVFRKKSSAHRIPFAPFLLVGYLLTWLAEL